MHILGQGSVCRTARRGLTALVLPYRAPRFLRLPAFFPVELAFQPDRFCLSLDSGVFFLMSLLSELLMFNALLEISAPPIQLHIRNTYGVMLVGVNKATVSGR